MESTRGEREEQQLHPTWMRLKPRKNPDETRLSDESVEDYVLRVTGICSVPIEVAEQWLYPHWFNPETTANYGWLDFSQVHFEHVTMPLDTFLGLRVIEDYQPFVERVAGRTPYEEFMCTPADLEHWRRHGTWRVPPVVLESSALQGWPAHADIGVPQQLIEGHTRLGYLRALFADTATRSLVDHSHEVYLLVPGQLQ